MDLKNAVYDLDQLGGPRIADDLSCWERDNSKFEGALEHLAMALLADDGGWELAPPSKL